MLKNNLLCLKKNTYSLFALDLVNKNVNVLNILL